MRDAFVGGKEGGVKDAAGVRAGEAAGFGHGVEDLAEGGGVDGEVVDRFVCSDGDLRGVAGDGEHGEDGAGVGSCERFSLEGVWVRRGKYERRKGFGWVR